MEEKKTWGGKRSGAGRPKGAFSGVKRPYKKVSLALLEEDYMAMREKAKKEAPELSFSKYIADKVLDRI